MIAAVVLAAGAATRFGAPKQQLLLGDVLARARRAPVDEVVVVEGAHALELPVEHAGARDRRGARTGSEGPARRCAAVWRRSAPETEAAVVVLADGPDLAPEAVARVIESWRASGGDARSWPPRY